MRFAKAFALSLCSLCSPWLIPIAHGQMRTLNTQHYQIHTDLDQRFAEDLGLRMDAMYAEYSSRLAYFSVAPKIAFEVDLFAHQADYAKLTDDRFHNTGGVFIRSRHLLAAFLEEQGRDTLRRTLQHEAFHQFADSVISSRLPPWVNEGIAQVFEEGIWTGRRFMLGQVPPRRLRQIHQDMTNHRLVPFRDFLTMTDAQWIDAMHDVPTGAAHYSQAWAMCQFLIFAADENGQPKYRSRFIDMLSQIHAGTKPADAFAQCFSNNLEAFQDRFLEYARTLKPTPEATFVEYQGVLADMMIAAHTRGKDFEDADAFRQFVAGAGVRLRYTRGDVQWSTDTDPNLYFRDAAGRVMTGQQFYLSNRNGSPLPDMICYPIPSLAFRTIFHNDFEKTDHETIVESK